MVNTSQHILWHTPQWEQVSQMLAQDRFAHALLLEGMNGVGKKIFAYQLAQMLLCQGNSDKDNTGGICQTCASCKWFIADTHPDFIVVSPEEGKKLISVDAIRQTTQQIFKTSHQDGYRILIIDPADAMTIEAANSLLKTLEEPPPRTLLILLTDKPARLLPTIRSRASRLQFRLPETEQALSWLQNKGLDAEKAQSILALSLGAPLRLDLESEQVEAILAESHNWWNDWKSLFVADADPVRIAKAWSKSDPSLLLAWLEGLIRRSIEFTMHYETHATTPIKSAQDVLYPGLDEFANKFNYQSLFRLRDNVVELSQRQQTSLNWGLQLEALACDCQALI